MWAKQQVKPEGKNAMASDILDAVDDAFFSLDDASRVTFANKAMGRLLGRDASELIDKNITDLIPEHVGWTFHRHLEKALSEGMFVKLDFFKLAGKRFEVYYHPLRNGLAVFLHDITLKWHTDELYRLSLFLLDRLNESVFLVRSDGRLFRVNDETSRLLGYTRDELIHMNIFDIDAHITVEGWADGFNSIKETKQAIFESMLKGKDGALIPVEVCANYIELYGNEYYCVAARDITERKKMEEALLNAEDFQRSILDSLQSHIAVIDESGVIVYVNEAWKRFGSENGACTEESVGVGINYFDVCRMASGDHSSEAPIALKGMIAVMNGESDVFELEYPCHSPDTNRWFHMKITPFVGRKKRGIVVYHNDITIRKLIEEDLKKSEANLVKAQRITHLGNWSWLIGIDEVKCSDEYYRIFGIEKRKSITYGQFISTVHPLDREFVNRAVNAALYNGKPYSIDYRVIWPDGSEHIIHAEGELNVDKANKPVLLFGVVQDITEQKLTEREMQKAKAMVEMYNDLLGHDINNMNQVGIGYLELALSSQGLSDETKELLSKPLEALINSSKLIENVKKLQRIKSGEVRHNKMDVNLVLLDVKKAISSINDRGIVIDYSPVPGCMVMANELLKDVFSNLVGNAIKHSKGPLEISMGISRVSADGKEHYRVYIEDNGPGIPDSIKNKLFTRFQRGDTQASGKGLGLYLVRTLVEDFDGRVWVEDRVPGDQAKGSRFVVMLPALT